MWPVWGNLAFWWAGPGTGGSLEVLLDRLERGQGGRVFWKPFYRRSDFDDERYRPMFTPLADDGQVVRFKLKLDPWNGDGNLRVGGVMAL